MRNLIFMLLILFCTTITSTMAQHTLPPILLFPEGAPGETEVLIEKADMSGDKVGGLRVLRISNVSEPSITYYGAPADNNSGAAIIVCPGGGYSILAYDLEGTEICERFNSYGINCVLLKYRVPRYTGLPKHAAPLQDLQRAIAYTRSHGQEWGIDEDKIGVIGFSAGAHLATMGSTSFNELTYPKLDAYDEASVRPDFCMLIYPAYLNGEDYSVASDIKIINEIPPTFFVQAQDDYSLLDSSLFYYYALKEVCVPVAMHLYPSGGHGYGLRNTGHLVNEWPERAMDWLTDIGMVDK